MTVWLIQNTCMCDECIKWIISYVLKSSSIFKISGSHPGQTQQFYHWCLYGNHPKTTEKSPSKKEVEPKTPTSWAAIWLIYHDYVAVLRKHAISSKYGHVWPENECSSVYGVVCAYKMCSAGNCLWCAVTFLRIDVKWQAIMSVCQTILQGCPTEALLHQIHQALFNSNYHTALLVQPSKYSQMYHFMQISLSVNSHHFNGVSIDQ